MKPGVGVISFASYLLRDRSAMTNHMKNVAGSPCEVCKRPLSKNGNCHPCNEIKALVRDSGFYPVVVVLGK